MMVLGVGCRLDGSIPVFMGKTNYVLVLVGIVLKR